MSQTLDFDKYKKLFESPNYLLEDINYLIDNQIYEYDIRKANISSLKSQNLLSDTEYNKFLYMDKPNREIIIGKMIRNNPDLYYKIQTGIMEAKKAFIGSNNIDPINILRIANDSIFTYGIKECDNLTVMINEYPITFVLKNKFTSYINLDKKLLFYGQNVNNWIIDVKGINPNNLNLHQKLLMFICSEIQYLEACQYNIAFKEFNDFYINYINLKVNIDYYRELNSSSCFRIKTSNDSESDYLLSDGTNIPLKYIDINYNLNILRVIYSMIVSCANKK